MCANKVMPLTIVLAAIFIAGTLVEGRKRYDGYQVLRVYPENERHLEYLHDLRENFGLDFWTDGIRTDFNDVMLAPAESHIIRAKMYLAGMKSEIFVPDVQALIDLSPSRPEGRAMDWTSYHRLSDIHDWMEELAAANPDWVSTEVIGQSYLGNDMKIIRINPNPARAAGQKFWIDGGIHAREWISPAVATYIINELVNNYEDNKELADSYDWYILPVHNPDGYEYAHTDDRLWRKTLTDHDSFWGCLGADANRNFNFHWLEAGSSSDKCSEIYAGPDPLSEKSCAAVAQYATSLNEDRSMIAYITLHSYSQLWMCPWGWSADHPENYDELKRVGDTGVAALTALYGTQYEFGTSVDILYYSSGSSRDWAYGALEVPYVYTIELRDTGRYGFVLPEDQIIPTCEETFAGIKAAALAMLS